MPSGKQYMILINMLVCSERQTVKQDLKVPNISTGASLPLLGRPFSSWPSFIISHPFS